MLKMQVRSELRGCFYGGVFGGQKRFYGVQNDCESVILAGYAYLCARATFASVMGAYTVRILAKASYFLGCSIVRMSLFLFDNS